MSEQNKKLVQRDFEEIYNRGNLAVADEIAASDLVIHTTSQDIHGRAAAKQYVTQLRSGFPDLHLAIEDQIAEGDRVVTRWVASGTHKGEFQGIPPTGRKVRVAGTAIDRIVGGKIVECWSQMDDLGMMQQLGVVTAP
jgi:steroid delta-isomerase-like uncharacterized protein